MFSLGKNQELVVHGWLCITDKSCFIDFYSVNKFYEHYRLIQFDLSKQKLGDIMEMTVGGRYIIMMMALFSIYTGFIYNEFFSVPFEIFGRSAYGCRDPSCR